MLRPKKNSYKEFDNEKNSCGSKIPHSPDNFSNGPSLSIMFPKILDEVWRITKVRHFLIPLSTTFLNQKIEGFLTFYKK